MININHEINRLINFALKKNLINNDDIIYSTNMILGVLNLNEFEVCEVDETLETPTPILENILDYACENNLIENTVTERDLFDTLIMNCVMPRPSEVINNFNNLYNISPTKATEYYYDLSISSNYIRKDRIDKNIIWKAPTEYGDLDITINLSKPEKDPRDIAKAKLIKSSSYPKCLLCKENEGFYGHINHPARQTHRIIPLDFDKQKYFLQYSPYTYYNEHCIILNSEHIPMKINKDTFRNLLIFTDILPHYFAGSNADLPIVGGSILSHDHYQGGHYTFAMEKAIIEKNYSVKNYEDVEIGRVKWPMSVVRLSSNDKDKLLDLADHILTSWRSYSDESVNILSHTADEPHNTITPIARKRNNKYELDLVLRNNRTSTEHPLGIFHPHSEVHHIKKENIGLIEVMGLAVLPARLKEELNVLKEYLINIKDNILDDEMVAKHSDWYKYLLEKYSNISQENVDSILKEEVVFKFLEVLCHSGVFKRNEKGFAAFDKFINIL
ncbi:UDP-glucose--hexose-1-phosphate uridylyltransferase [Clostridium beijerinckii]|uniref:Galactose-1-phosphate uridylyltransferase n=1 Tax=Clostridium beijerinckii TaxID=1520 RepID=A0AAW3W3R4_CLOBE|nr:UDP-glucose--hexose-1-phosphate uridylyltransferase [Clostridium beijerinckii]MBC2458776.1 UDP-glucose--hexose-1-phosphate uridylyltransferase [Clostridium beijerinckii]MBC2473526.1 UDP-glucose--hexose-1-phosphate uridylyltransferase [Clostridium beijerinckii]NOV61952.1 UDPglucose--hexose-1-phosphate uridylyltransferase [Clostridium beijerinckii]NOV68552.1 UDPglucose--hexose-1-phosphate uridylyltransferase [Clostridium beijerinckii]NOW35336.1 UDPglucose--hexose-1-phosphate uridylyltransfera